jgi:hypothetical protein
MYGVLVGAQNAGVMNGLLLQTRLPQGLQVGTVMLHHHLHQTQHQLAAKDTADFHHSHCSWFGRIEIYCQKVHITLPALWNKYLDYVRDLAGTLLLRFGYKSGTPNQAGSQPICKHETYISSQALTEIQKSDNSSRVACCQNSHHTQK